jgi:hypothetical protein
MPKSVKLAGFISVSYVSSELGADLLGIWMVEITLDGERVFSPGGRRVLGISPA